MKTLPVLVLLISQRLSQDSILDHKPPYPILTHQPDNRCGHQRCPPGHRDFGFGSAYIKGVEVKGRFCGQNLNVYGRGWGYAWEIGDHVGDYYPALRRCIADNPILGCEFWGAMAYPKCRWGYTNFGCCLCESTRAGIRINNFNCLLPCTAESYTSTIK